MLTNSHDDTYKTLNQMVFCTAPPTRPTSQSKPLVDENTIRNVTVAERFTLNKKNGGTRLFFKTETNKTTTFDGVKTQHESDIVNYRTCRVALMS